MNRVTKLVMPGATLDDRMETGAHVGTEGVVPGTLTCQSSTPTRSRPGKAVYVRSSATTASTARARDTPTGS